ncbi:MAG: hypothetical protein M3065_15800 [Actinomycetota bacterium]|nr:hypothetical protein [Actinomycetota bacterium]
MPSINTKRLVATAALAIAAGGATVASAATSSSPFRIVPSPSPGSPRLLASAAISPTDVWAVGSDDRTREGIAEHWNGHTWTVVATPTRVQGGGGLVSVSAVSSTNVWAVGAESTIEHWNGTAWSVVPSPVPTTFTSVHAIGANNVYAVSTGGEGGDPGFVETLERQQVERHPDRAPQRHTRDSRAAAKCLRLVSVRCLGAL